MHGSEADPSLYCLSQSHSQTVKVVLGIINTGCNIGSTYTPWPNCHVSHFILWYVFTFTMEGEHFHFTVNMD